MKHGEQRVPTGIRFEQAVSEALSGLNISHEITECGSEMDTKDQIDITIHPPDGRGPVHFQITLRRGAWWKIRRFVEATLRSAINGPRVYLEVLVSKATLWHQGIPYAARRVAWGIRFFVKHVRDFGRYQIVGLRFPVKRSPKYVNFERFSLNDLIEEILPRILKEFRDAAERLALEAAEAAEAARSDLPKIVALDAMANATDAAWARIERRLWPDTTRQKRLRPKEERRPFIPHAPPPRRAFARLRLP